jgi:hypothetical protein
MAGHLFVPQSQLDAWLEAGTVDIDAEGMRVPAESLRVGLEPAFRFVQLLEGEDGEQLLSRVRSEGQLRELGADACGNSVILGDVAYEVVPGFLLALEGPVAAPAAAPAGERKDRKEEADLLSRFFLEKVR